MAGRIIPLYITPGGDREAVFGFKILNAIKDLRNYIQGIFSVAKKN